VPRISHEQYHGSAQAMLWTDRGQQVTGNFSAQQQLPQQACSCLHIPTFKPSGRSACGVPSGTLPGEVAAGRQKHAVATLTTHTAPGRATIAAIPGTFAQSRNSISTVKHRYDCTTTDTAQHQLQDKRGPIKLQPQSRLIGRALVAVAAPISSTTAQGPHPGQHRTAKPRANTVCCMLAVCGPFTGPPAKQVRFI